MDDGGMGASAFVVGLALGACAACGGNPESATDAPDAPRVFESADVEVLGTSESLAFVLDLEVLPDGRVWVLNSMEPFFVGFAPDGTVLAEHGVEGGGPEEVLRAVSFVTGGIDGDAWALDTGRHAFIRVSRPDAPWTRIALPEDSVPPASLIGLRDVTFVRVRTARLGGEVIVPRTSVSGGSGMLSMWRSIWGADLLAIDPATGSARTVVRLGEALGDPTPHMPTDLEFPPIPVWYRIWTVCPGSEIRVHDRLRNQIRGFTAAGAELPPIALPEPDLTFVTAEQFARATLEAAAVEAAGSIGLDPPRIDTARLLPALSQRIQGDAAELAALLPRYVDLHCAEDGALWIRPFDIEVGGLRGGPGWLRITPDGRIREVRLPPRFDPLRFTSGRIWGVQRDTLDVPSVAWIDW